MSTGSPPFAGRRENLSRLAQLRGEARRLVHGDAARHGFTRGVREFGDALGDGPSTRGAECAERASQCMSAQLALRSAGRALERVGGLPQMLAMAHQLETVERRGPSALATGWGAAVDDRSHGLDGYD